MRAEGRPAMTTAQVQDFVHRFMPVYEQYLPPLYDGQDDSNSKRFPRLSIMIGADRQVLSIHEASRTE
jgi:hypothetical protein